MSYDMSLIDIRTRKNVDSGKYKFVSIYDQTPSGTIRVDPELLRDGIVKEVDNEKHVFEFNATYNYSILFNKCLFNREGIRGLYTKNVNEIIPILHKALEYLIEMYSDVFCRT
jgi:hypothetical protein